MTATTAVQHRQRELEEQRAPFVRATVVRTEHPTSAHTGDVAVIDAQGVMTGFVGGACVEASVREYGLRALDAGEPVLLQVRPSEAAPAELEGAVVVHNLCLSGGSVDIFLEPVLPAAVVVVVGGAPVADALARIGAELGYDMQLVDGDQWHPAGSEAAVIVASHGRGEEPALERALEAGIPYVGLVASVKRGAAVVASLNLSDEARHRVHTPAGLKLGGTSPAEIALGVLAELVQVRASTGAQPPQPAPEARPVSATDPVCGMIVIAADPTLRLEHEGATIWFCSGGCRARFEKEPERYAAA